MFRLEVSLLQAPTTLSKPSKIINVTQIYVSTIYFILKQGYMFRLEVSHLQASTTFSLPDAKHLVTNKELRIK